MTRFLTSRGRSFAAALAVLALLAGCRSSVEAAPAASTASACPDSSKHGCRSVVLPDGSTLRFAVLGGQDSPDRQPRQAVLVDAGGPGLSIFGEQWPEVLERELSSDLPDATLVLLEEPWVTSEVPQACDEAVTVNFRAVHASDPTAEPASLSQACGLGTGRWGWTAASYRTAVGAVAHAENLDFEGFVGISFGAQRLRYAPDLFRWAVVANPAPATATGADYLRARDAGIANMLSTLCGCSTDALEQQIRTTADRMAAAPAETPGRSIPVTSADVGAAALALSYQSADVRAAGAASVLGRTTDDALIGALADRTWLRFGDDQVSPAYLAYLDEVCSAYGPWPAANAGQDRPVAQALAALHAPCAGVPSNAAALHEVPAGLALCASSAVDDPVAPPEFSANWAALGAFQVTTEGDSHGDLTGIGRCLDHLGTGGTGTPAGAAS